MYIERVATMSGGKAGQGADFPHGVVRWTAAGTFADIADRIREEGLTSLVFLDAEFFADHKQAMALCRDMRLAEVNALWSAHLAHVPSGELLCAMRLAGCQRLDMRLEPDQVADALAAAREFGFEVRVTNGDGTSSLADGIHYTVAEREAIVERLPGLHSVQFDLAVAYYNARRFREVMLPLGKAMTLGFPMNELCLNLLACLGAAKHYPDMAAGLLDQARHGCPHPVVFRNRKLLRSWLESGGDVRGVRLMLEPETGFSRAQ